MPRKVQVIDEPPEGLAGQIEAEVRSSGAVALRTLTQVKLSQRGERLLHEALGRRGLERTGKVMRVPLREQVIAALADGPVATAALRKRLRGLSSAGELTPVLADLARSGRAAIVMRSGVEHVAAPSPAVLSAGELAGVADLARVLGKAVSSARRPGRSLWRADLLAIIDRAKAALDGVDPVVLVVEAVRRHASATTGLAPVPAVARALGDRLPDQAVRDALLAAAAAGRLELRPESGVGLLAPADAALCPRGADGWPLSWAREIR